MGESTKQEWQDLVKEYYDENGNNEDSIGEWVDNITPIYYSEIKEQFDDFSFEITSDQVGLAMWEVMARTINEQLYDRFVQELHEYSDSIDEEE